MSGILGIGGGGDIEFYPYTLDQSVRFNDDDTAMLSKTFGSAGNSKTWTWSGWVKRGNLGDTRPFFVAGSSGSAIFQAVLMTYNSVADRIQIYNYDGSYNLRFATTQVFRDVSGWYHIVLKMDTTQATSTDRFKLYINGEAVTAFEISTYPSQNFDTYVNTAASHRIGRNFDTAVSTKSLDGYLAEVNFIDGTALDASSFGETKNGIWIPKQYTGSYGTNGFKLAFQDSASLGDDTSGNGHDFTSSGLASTDQMLDSPTNNFAVLNAVAKSSGITLSDGNLKADGSSGGAFGVNSTLGMTSGKWYTEFIITDRPSPTGNGDLGIFANSSGNPSSTGVDDGAKSCSIRFGADDGDVRQNNATVVSTGISFTNGDVINIAFDRDDGKVWFGKNGTYYNSGNPAAGTNATYSTNLDDDLYFFNMSDATGSATVGGTFNFGQDSTFAGNLAAGGNADANGIGDFKYTVPSGYLALCAANLPDPGIDPNADETPEDYFNTVLWTGDNTSPRSITGVGFQPDWVWIKRRNIAKDHGLFDSVRGSTLKLESNTTAAEITGDNGKIDSFDSDGFTISTGTIDNSGVNGSANTFVAWSWKAGGTAVSNGDGTITSSVSASPESGFSIVSYTGTGSAGTVGHGLGKAPSMVILKNRDGAYFWPIYHAGVAAPATTYLEFDTVIAQTGETHWNSTAPTSTVFSVNTQLSVNNLSDEYIAYCFAEIEGYSKMGSYVGNNLTDGPFIYTGFRPAWLMVKRTDVANSWYIVDTVRTSNINAGNDDLLYPNLNNAEGSTNDFFNVFSNGFKLPSTSPAVNASGGTYIYLAFAEQPFKYANAR